MLRLFHKLGKVGRSIGRRQRIFGACNQVILLLRFVGSGGGLRGGLLWMVRTDTKIGKQQLLAAGMLASAVWFNGYEYRVDVFQGLGVVRL